MITNTEFEQGLQAVHEEAAGPGAGASGEWKEVPDWCTRRTAAAQTW